MADLKFLCPSCRQNLEAPEDMSGATVQCPSCSTTITVPLRMATASVYSPPPRMKDCPYCSEQIMATAKKCKHCGEIIDVALRAVEERNRRYNTQMVNVTPSFTPKKKDEPWTGGEMTGLVFATLIIPLIGFIMGIIGLTKESRKGQGAGLLVLAIIMTVIYCSMMT